MIEIDAFVNTSVCRCCMSRGTFKQLREKYNWMGQDEIYANMLRDCFNITLSTNEIDDSDGICELCIAQLRNALNFKNQVKEADKQFRASSINFKKDRSVKVEILNKEEDDFHNLDDFIDESEEYKVTIEPELVETKPKLFEKRKRKTKPCSSKLKRVENPENFDDLAETSTTALDVRRYEKHLPERKKQRHNLVTILKYSNATPFADKSVLGYHCAYCGTPFLHPEDLRAHTHKDHEKIKYSYKAGSSLNNYFTMFDVTSLKCNICDTNQEDFKLLSEHLTMIHKKKIYTDIPDYLQPFELTTHRVTKCHLCSLNFDNFILLRHHMNQHYRNFICKICGSGFINKYRLMRHEKTHQEGSSACKFCHKVYQSESKRKVHEQMRHSTEATMRNKCRICGERFSNHYQKSRHMIQAHNTELVKCNACDKSFVAKTVLTAHIRRDHLMERSYECGICKKSFYIKRNLNEHLVKHTGERSFQCSVCGKSYGRKKNLQAHIKTHCKGKGDLKDTTNISDENV